MKLILLPGSTGSACGHGFLSAHYFLDCQQSGFSPSPPQKRQQGHAGVHATKPNGQFSILVPSMQQYIHSLSPAACPAPPPDSGTCSVLHRLTSHPLPCVRCWSLAGTLAPCSSASTRLASFLFLKHPQQAATQDFCPPFCLSEAFHPDATWLLPHLLRVFAQIPPFLRNLS